TVTNLLVSGDLNVADINIGNSNILNTNITDASITNANITNVGITNAIITNITTSDVIVTSSLNSFDIDAISLNVSGLATFYSSGGSIGFKQQGSKLVGTGATGRSSQGTSISLSADGNTLAIGGLYDDSH